MSLKWLHENLLKSKDLREFGQNKFDYKNESVVPRQMRNSLCSVDVCEVSPSASVEAVNGDETLKNVSDDEDLFEIARSCPEDCLHRDCPFQSRLLSSSEVFYSVDSRYTQSSVSLVRKVSSMSFLEVSSHFDDNEFLRISRVVPVRNSSVIIHWNVKSTIGIRGYKIHVDGFLISTVFSAERTSAYITNINMSLPHHISLSIILDTLAIFSNKLYLLEPALYFHDPL